MPMEQRFKGKRLDALLAEVCWWSHKISEYEGDHADISEGNSEEDMPLSHVSSSEDTNSEDEAQPPTKKTKPSTSQASMEIDE